MSDYTAIADFSESIRTLIFAELHQELGSIFDSDDKVSLKSPAEIKTSNDNARLSIYLFRIVEDPYTKNGSVVSGNGGKLRKRPLTLELHYLVTPLPAPKFEPVDQHKVMGKVMQVLYDNAILQGSDLAEPLATAGEEVRIVLNPVPLEEIARVWQAMEMDYHLSVCYVARVAIIDSQIERAERPVLSKAGVFGESN